MFINAKGIDLMNPDRLLYKGVYFDEFTIEKSQGDNKEWCVWSEICPVCKGRFYGLDDVLTPEGASGTCSVVGCANIGEDFDEGNDYVDFKHEELYFYYHFRTHKQICLSYKEWEKAVNDLVRDFEEKCYQIYVAELQKYDKEYTDKENFLATTYLNKDFMYKVLDNDMWEKYCKYR